MTAPADQMVAAVSPGWKARLQDGQRWKVVGYDMLLWFMGSVVATTLLSLYAPGRPILVATDSIQTGVYWLDQRAATFSQGDYVTFDFRPTQSWLKARYDHEHRIHTKMVRGVAGDTVRADAELNLTICRAGGAAALDIPTTDCWSVGRARANDSKGRPMASWLPAGSQYTLQQGELWAFGPNPLSLDSRYQGPIRAASVKGKASPLWLFAIH